MVNKVDDIDRNKGPKSYICRKELFFAFLETKGTIKYSQARTARRYSYRWCDWKLVSVSGGVSRQAATAKL